jgi:hypothetical protein
MVLAPGGPGRQQNQRLRGNAKRCLPGSAEASSPRKRRGDVSAETQRRRLRGKRRGDVSAETSDAIAAGTRPASPPTTPICPTSPERHCCHCSSHCARPQAAGARPRHHGRRELKRHRWPIVVALTTSMAHRCCLPGTHETPSMRMAWRMRLTGRKMSAGLHVRSRTAAVIVERAAQTPERGLPERSMARPAPAARAPPRPALLPGPRSPPARAPSRRPRPAPLARARPGAPARARPGTPARGLRMRTLVPRGNRCQLPC